MFKLEEEVLGWRLRLVRSGIMDGADAEELEGHLWDLIEADLYGGTPPEEAFRRAAARMGAPEDISREYSILYKEVFMELEKNIIELRENPAELESLYHQKPQAFAGCLARALESHPEAPVLRAWEARLTYAPFRADRRKELTGLLVLILLCAASALAVKIPALWGLDFWTGMRVGPGGITPAADFFQKNFTFMFLPMIGFLYAFRQRPPAAVLGVVIGIFAVSLAAMNLFPSFPPNDTRLLSELHMPLLLWLAVGLAFTGRDWRNPASRLDFIRTTGELFIYTVLILLGGGVLTFFTMGIFSLIGLDIMGFYLSSIATVGLFCAPLVGAYLAERKREIVESFAPVLAYIFTPLFLVTLVTFLGTMAVLGKSPYTDRSFLLYFNGMLVLVIALILFNITERKMDRSARLFDAMNAVLIVAALAVDGIALSAIIARLASYGASPNKIAVLGENILLLGNLIGLGWQYGRFFMGRARFSAVENWTARCLPVYFTWLAVVVFAFPVLFRFL